MKDGTTRSEFLCLNERHTNAQLIGYSASKVQSSLKA